MRDWFTVECATTDTQAAARVRHQTTQSMRLCLAWEWDPCYYICVGDVADRACVRRERRGANSMRGRQCRVERGESIEIVLVKHERCAVWERVLAKTKCEEKNATKASHL